MRAWAALVWCALACDAPCEPDRHPAVIVHLSDRGCDGLVVLLGQADRPTQRCTMLPGRGACEAWCGRARLNGPARLRVQTVDGAEIADLGILLPNETCPTGAGVELVIEGDGRAAR